MNNIPNCKPLVSGCFNNINEWFTANNISNQLIRWWHKNPDPANEELENIYSLCDFGYIVQIIPIGNDFLLGIQPCDPDSEGERYASIQYQRLSEILITWYDNDQSPEEE